MKRQKGMGRGFFHGMNMQARLAEAAFLSMLLKYKDEKGYADDGYETWEDFCREALGLSDDTMRRRFKALETFGAETTRIMIDMGFKWKDIRAIENVLTEDQRTALKNGVLQIGDNKIPITEDRAPDILAAVDLLIERAALAQKEAKLSKSKLEGIEKEAKKEKKAYDEKIKDLEARLTDPSLPEGVDAFFKTIESTLTDCVVLANRIDFQAAFPDPLVKGKGGFPVVAIYNQRVLTIETQFNNLLDSLREAVHGK